MRNRLNIQTVTNTRSDNGGFTQTWATAATRWGRIEPMQGKEGERAAQTHTFATHKVTMRWYDGLTNTMRLLFGTRAFGIIESLNIEERNRVHVLLVKEEAA
jgi:SPP1 family predicted phage head-tail adaptor